MLTHIQIKNFALIDDLSVELDGGFNVLTGETGAGKSIIIDAITTVLGGRASSEFIRTGADRASVEAVFDISGDERACARAEELGFECEDGALLLSREITTAGKSQCRVNGRISTLSMMKDLTSGLLDIHGQHEHQSLLGAETHIDILDRWLGADATTLRAHCEELYGELRTVRGELERLKRDQRERARMLDLYEFQRTEIDAAQLVAGEDEELAAERSRLANAEKLYELAGEVYDGLNGSTELTGAVDLISAAVTSLRSMAAIDESLAQTLADLETALYSAEQAQDGVREYRDDIEFNPTRLEAVEERIDLIRTLRRKYGDSIEEIVAYGSELAKKINDLTHSEERTAELGQKIERVEDELMGVARRLRDVRKSGAAKFSSHVESQLAELAMGSTKFEVAFEDAQPSAKGIDIVEFVISPNPGEPLKPLAKIASGGELSRLMLALKTVMAGSDRVPTLIFDEIDTGIGGRTAQVLGEKLAAVGRSAQVLCVTHLAQIASRADVQFSVQKLVEGSRTVVRLDRVEGESRVEELARMLGGAEDSRAALEHAREMLGP